MEMGLTICPFGCASVHCSLFGSVSYFWFGNNSNADLKPSKLPGRCSIWIRSPDNPPPCTLFYLANCKFGSECQYGHDYLLSEDDYESIRTNAKSNPCTAIMKGESPGFFFLASVYFFLLLRLHSLAHIWITYGKGRFADGILFLFGRGRMSMGFQMRLRPCVPVRPQMPPPPYPQVQILRRRDARCGLKESKRRIARCRWFGAEISSFFAVIFFFLSLFHIFFARIRSMLGFVKYAVWVVYGLLRGGRCVT